MNLLHEHPCEICGDPFQTVEGATECAVSCAGTRSRRLRKRVAKAEAMANRHPCEICKKRHATKKRATGCCTPRYPW